MPKSKTGGRPYNRDQKTKKSSGKGAQAERSMYAGWANSWAEGKLSSTWLRDTKVKRSKSIRGIQRGK